MGRTTFVGQILKGQKNGKAKEYDEDGNLKFEGEYLNDKKHGKAKEYYKGDLWFDIEYLNGKKHGKGKHYEDGHLLFDGEYRNGAQWNGIRKRYDDNGKMISEEVFLDGKVVNIIKKQ